MQIKLDKVNYTYQPGTVYEHKALFDVSLQISEGQFIALAGSTGSGKSTLVQILNGLKLPDSGTVLYDGTAIHNDKKALRQIRCRVGLVFQYPEYQLFDETVLKDVMFGPKNKGLSVAEAQEKAMEALRKVGFSEELFQKSPFDLSGGEKRKAAIAGMLAMEPEILVLDEPTAGLDPAGKIQILNLLKRIHEAGNTTILMVTHNMDEAAEYANRVMVMDAGRLIMDGDPHDIFANAGQLTEIGLSVPQVTSICQKLGISGCITQEEAAQAIMKKYHSSAYAGSPAAALSPEGTAHPASPAAAPSPEGTARP